MDTSFPSIKVCLFRTIALLLFSQFISKSGFLHYFFWLIVHMRQNQLDYSDLSVQTESAKM